jgi:ADP-ribosylglycohydrolase
MKLSSVTHRDRILGGLWGSLVGDALGVPVEFKSRAAVQADPVTDMRGFSLWCLLNSRTYDDCVLKAVNLGGDTDTTGCVAGGLAGVLYGVGAIPLRWREALAKREEVAKLFERFADLVEPEQR